jgi:hypothetical protein
LQTEITLTKKRKKERKKERKRAVPLSSEKEEAAALLGK